MNCYETKEFFFPPLFSSIYIKKKVMIWVEEEFEIDIVSKERVFAFVAVLGDHREHFLWRSTINRIPTVFIVLNKWDTILIKEVIY